MTTEEIRKSILTIEAAKIVTDNKQRHRVQALDKAQQSFEELLKQKMKEKYFMEHGNK